MNGRLVVPCMSFQVGGIKPGCFKIGNTGGMMDNIIDSKLYRPGSVAYVSKSGGNASGTTALTSARAPRPRLTKADRGAHIGMSNELNNIISRATDGVYEGVAIGGDRYPGTTFIDHVMRFEKDPACKLIVLLGEVRALALASAPSPPRPATPPSSCLFVFLGRLAGPRSGRSVRR